MSKRRRELSDTPDTPATSSPRRHSRRGSSSTSVAERDPRWLVTVHPPESRQDTRDPAQLSYRFIKWELTRPSGQTLVLQENVSELLASLGYKQGRINKTYLKTIMAPRTEHAEDLEISLSPAASDQHICDLYQLIDRLLQNAVGFTQGCQRPGMLSSDPIYRAMRSHLLARAVKTDENDPQQDLISSGLSGVSFRVPKTLMLTSEFRRSPYAKIPLSVDHVNQVTLKFTKSLDGIGKIQPVFVSHSLQASNQHLADMMQQHDENNVMVTTRQENLTKHRYFTTIFACYMLISSVGDRVDYLHRGHAVFPVIQRLIDIVADIYPIWPISCLHGERLKSSAEVICEAIEYVDELNKKLGFEFASPPAPRPSAFEYRRVPKHDATLANIKLVGGRLMKEAASMGINILKNQDGIPSMSLNGQDNAEDIARACAAALVHLRARGYAMPAHELYALVIWQNVDRCRKSLDRGKTVDDLVLTSGTHAVMPFIVPSQNKGPFSPSSSRRDHAINEYRTGFATNEPETISLLNRTAESSFFIDPWCTNASLGACSGQDGLDKEVKRMEMTSKFWVEGVGKNAGWLLRDQELWTPADEARLVAFFEWLHSLY
ncbi:hypothetical protein ACM66B_004712 [Microbotryomycetes sp. NB124-2]